jgi:hypothetical protein
MSDTPKPLRAIPQIDANEAHALVMRLDEITAKFRGQFDELEAAIGMYMLGRLVGWKVLALIHNKRTIRKYEEILGINVREEFDEEGPFADKSIALNVVKKLGTFWKAVNGVEKDSELREKRRELAL